MNNENINTLRFEEYKKIFGLSKMKKLWQEFLESSQKNWQEINNTEYEHQKQFFHNWRSNSLVFGMNKFAKLCEQIEENILCHRYSKIPELISLSKECYDNSIKDVKMVFKTWEKHND